MVSEEVKKEAAGGAIIVGTMLLLYRVAENGALTPAIVAATLPVLGLGAALIVGGGTARAYILRRMESGSSSDSQSSNSSQSGE